MVLLDQLLILLIKAGVKAYKESQRNKALAQAGGSSAAAAATSPPATPAASHSVPRRSTAVTTTANADALLQVARAFVNERVDDPARVALRAAATDTVITPAMAGVDTTRLQFLQRTMGTLQQLDGQRADPRKAPILTDLDRVALAYYKPLLEFEARRGIRLSTQLPVVFFGEGNGSLTALMSRSPIAPVEVTVRTQHDVLAWPQIAREVGRDMVLSVDGLREELRVAAGFPQTSSALPSGILDETTVRSALGVWLVELCADAIAGLIAGPAYLATLSSQLRSPDEPYRVRVVSASNGRLSPVPPPELRLGVVSMVLQQIGMDDESRPILHQWRDLHGEELEFYFPTGQGRFAAIPEDYYIAPVRELAQVLCQHQAAALAGMQLLDVPDLHYSLHRHHTTTTALETLRRRQVASGDPRAVVGAAALLGFDDPARRIDTLPLLRQSLGSKGHAVATTGRRSTTAGETLTSPQVLRDAVILQGLFSPRHRASS